MFRYHLSSIAMCVATIGSAGSVRVVGPVHQEVDNEVIESPADETSQPTTPDDDSDKLDVVVMHIIGNTRGDDDNYLFRCLESTGRIEVQATDGQLIVRWAAGMSESDPWEIVILGDFLDLDGPFRPTLSILKSLTEDPSWGKRLVVMLGSRESRFLEGFPDFVDRTETVSYLKRMEDLYAEAGSEGHSLVSWLRQRPVVYFSHSLLITYGGLSKLYASQIAEHLGCRHDCGPAIQDFINNVAHQFYGNLHQFYLENSSDLAKWTSISMLPDILSDSDDATKVPGVLGYKGWSSRENGAGSDSVCLEAEEVGDYLGPRPVMVMAHAMNPRISQFCEDFKVPIFAVDTHPEACNGHDVMDCEFAAHNGTDPVRHYIHSGKFPLALKLTQKTSSREFSACYAGAHRYFCRVLRTDIFSDVWIHLSDPTFVQDDHMKPELSDGDSPDPASDVSDSSDAEPMDASASKRKRKVERERHPKISSGESYRHPRFGRQKVQKRGELDVLTDWLGFWNPVINLADTDSASTGGSSSKMVP